ncbi:MAG: DUF928 domain-containing protein [Pseudomonadota bacterium]|nr:DUF928 domain-containing protein [Pseudomonadota bacterium]
MIRLPTLASVQVNFLALTLLTMFIPLSAQAKEEGFKPTVKGAPFNRVGGGSRGICAQLPKLKDDFSLEVLAPRQHVGQTHKSQPTLYWWTSQPVTGKITFTLKPVKTNSSEFPLSLIETQIASTVEAGIHEIPLSQYQAQLTQNDDIDYYEWSISIECDSSNPSANIVARGAMSYTETSEQLTQQLAQKDDPQALLKFYQDNGLWYDVVAKLFKSTDTLPKQVELLEQEGLEKVSQTVH